MDETRETQIANEKAQLAAFKSPIMRYFAYRHLPEKLQSVSAPFCELAISTEKDLPDGAEKSTCLRKLLEAKDCAVRTLV